jgi:hypothetical protein
MGVTVEMCRSGIGYVVVTSTERVMCHDLDRLASVLLDCGWTASQVKMMVFQFSPLEPAVSWLAPL